MSIPLTLPFIDTLRKLYQNAAKSIILSTPIAISLRNAFVLMIILGHLWGSSVHFRILFYT